MLEIKHYASIAVYWIAVYWAASLSPDSSILKIWVFDFVRLLIIWLLEVTDRFLKVGLDPPPLYNHAPVRECSHLWLDGGSLLWIPFLHVFSPWKKWILWVCCRGRAAHTHISGDRLTRTDLREDLPLVPNSETVNTGCIFFPPCVPVFWQRIKEYPGLIIGWNICGSEETAWVRHGGCASAHSSLDYYHELCR